MLSLLRYPWRIGVGMIAIMSGGLSLYREVYGLYAGVLPPRSVFWACVYLAFVISAGIAWLQEHLSLSEEKNKHLGPVLFVGWGVADADKQFRSRAAGTMIVINDSNEAAYSIEVEQLTFDPTVVFETIQRLLPQTSVAIPLRQKTGAGSLGQDWEKLIFANDNLWSHRSGTEGNSSGTAEFNIVIRYQDGSPTKYRAVFHVKYQYPKEGWISTPMERKRIN